MEIGTGHVMRCLTLARALREQKHNLIFVCKEHEGHIENNLKKDGFPVFLLLLQEHVDEGLAHSKWLSGTQQTDAEQTIEISEQYFESDVDLIIVDHYGIDARWHTHLNEKSGNTKILVIDDLADRDHLCDYLLDQTFMRPASDYLQHVPNRCKLLLGTRFALLRPEFAEESARAGQIRHLGMDEKSKRVLVMMGGTDHLNVTERVLKAIQDETSISQITAVLGPTAPHRNSIERQFGSDPRFEFLSGASNMAELMLAHDICFGAAGTASWERCVMGLPSIVVAFAENQRLILSMLNQFGAVSVFELTDTPNSIKKRLHEVCEIETYRNMVENCFKVSDGLGAERVIGALKQ
ncbi:UDP-2,4-diacetamido-2,4,6-trideoxy-beta-L-altropyranose hydrolase [Vibrio profundum]